MFKCKMLRKGLYKKEIPGLSSIFSIFQDDAFPELKPISYLSRTSNYPEKAIGGLTVA